MYFYIKDTQIELDKRSLAIIGGALLAGYLIFSGGEIERPAGQSAPKEPIQVMLEQDKIKPFNKNDYLITPVANYEFEARVLSTENYWLGGASDLSPVDLAIGWGEMSDTSLLKQLKFSHGRRFFNYRYDATYTGTHSGIVRHIGNVHVIPANSSIESDVKSLRKGQIVRVAGKLVVATKNNGWRWGTSLTRDDDGAGACELMYVEKVELI